MHPKVAASNLSLRQLRAFLAVSQEASMTRAAAKLHLTPSALSMLVRAMEDDLGTRLFERTTRRLVLTEEGQQFLPVVQQVFAQLEAGIAALHDRQQVKASLLRVAASPLLASALFPKVIASFRAQHPQVKVVLMDVPVEALPELVRQGDVDLAICTAMQDVQDLTATPLYEDKLMLACPASHPVASAREVAWQNLLDEPLILLRHGSGLRTLVEQAFSKWNKRLQPAYEVSQVATALGLVAEGEGVSVLPSYAITRAQAAAQENGFAAVATVALVSPVVKREIVALTKQGSAPMHVAAAFVEHFKKYAGKY